MASMENFSPIDLFRMAHSKNAVAAAGIRLVNTNGLLNLWAWANDLNGHLIPHGDLPEDFRGTETPRLIAVRQNGLLTLRQENYLRHHTRMAMRPDGNWITVRRVTEALYDDDMESPLYADSVGFKGGSFSTVYISDVSFWWISIASGSTNMGQLYEHWRMLCTWLIRFVPPVEASTTKPIPEAVKFHIHFESVIDIDPHSITIPSTDELEAAFRIRTDATKSEVEIHVGRAFDLALASPENIAEKALVAAMLRGLRTMVEESSHPEADCGVVGQICGSNLARSRHIMPAQTFRDMLHTMAGKPVHIHKMDDAIARIGIAFRVQSDVGAEILGKRECTAFLNEAVKLTQREICAQLRLFNRRQFINALLQCHEEAAISRHHWLRTAHANIALHGDAAEQAIAEHMAEMTACSISTRVLIEAANSECPAEGGFTPGDLDLSKVMARVIFAFHVGGWSDAIHWGAIAPQVRIAPVGDIHVDHRFIDTVYVPFASGGTRREVFEAVDSYGEAYGELPPVKSVASAFDERFLEAWEDEFGVPLDVLRKFTDTLENHGIDQQKLWFELRRSELLEMLSKCAEQPVEDVAATLDRLTLPVRTHWGETPTGFRDKDWHPWRFRRRLSLLRRPLIALETTEDPLIVIAPAVVREALHILVRSHHTGETPDWQVSSRSMLKWLGDTNNVTRTAFNATVASQLEKFGWKSASDYKISRLLGIPLDRNYGDVDALAWDPQSGRVLAIECKHLHFHKTIGEVAEQLSDFRGEIKQDGTRDLLRKHLDRIIVMETNAKIIRKRLRLREDPQIEAYVVFKNPVPMEFSWPQTTPRIRPLIFSQLETLRLAPSSHSTNS
ncbi:hypothetical protein [Terriglobus sp. TAA 43]|uniref:hypothetical protein n=1 Tax=Terriglobus sp. TAA 43 TaxID=278961 RepID=UPI0012EDA32E|nr:hypothetical protein [Terriglobus sp. TAA 43]